MTQARRSFWQVLAQVLACDTAPMAKAVAAHQVIPSWRGLFINTTRSTVRLNWQQRLSLGPLFSLTAARAGQEKYWHKPEIDVESVIIKTKLRGTSCGNFWQSLFWSCLWRAVLITIFSAACWARAPAQRWLGLRAAAMLRARFWAACSERSATTSNFAGRATDTAFGQRRFIWKRSNGQDARLTFFVLGCCPPRRA